jgi:ATP-dependent DNA ligase
MAPNPTTQRTYRGDERDDMTKTTLYKTTRTGKIQQWSIWVVECGESGYPEVTIEFGQRGGKQQITRDAIKAGMNVGRSNATTPLQQAYLEMERNITKQIEEGYKTTIAEALVVQTIDFSKPMPKELCYFKPKTSCDPKRLAKLEAAHKAIYTVKRDGLMHIAVSSDLGVDMYSRRMDVVSGKFPHLMTALSNLPDRTVLLGEVIYDEGGRDNFRTCCSICRSDDELAVSKQAQHPVSYYTFDIAFLNGVCLLTTKTFAERRKLLCEVVGKLESKHITVSEVIHKTHAEAMIEVKERHLEGLVIWDADGIMKDGEAYTFNGKAYRPNMVWKSKPRFETDAIARFDPNNGIGGWGTGKNGDKMKSVCLYQLDEAGNEVFICKCGGGFDDDTRTKYSNPSIFPCVFQIEFDSIMSGTGALRFPVFVREREDKGVDECVLDDRIVAAKEEEPEEE